MKSTANDAIYYVKNENDITQFNSIREAERKKD